MDSTTGRDHTITLEQWLAKYPPTSRHGRVVASCECNWDGCEGWVWTYRPEEATPERPFPFGPSPWETILEPQPTY